MNLTQAIAELKARGFDYIDNNAPGRSTIILNNAKNALEDEWQWPWLETTVTGAAPLTVADLKYVLSVVDTTNHAELQGVDFRDVVDMDTDPTTAGTPTSFWLDGTGTLRIYPTSASVSLSVRYVKFSPELSAGSDIPLIPVRYHPVWIDYAVAEAYKDDEQYALAAQVLADVRQRRLTQMIETYGWRNRANSGYQAITVGSEDW